LRRRREFAEMANARSRKGRSRSFFYDLLGARLATYYGAFYVQYNSPQFGNARCGAAGHPSGLANAVAVSVMAE